MPNPIKYSTTSQSLALKTGNYYIGTGDVGKGPTSSTDYYNGITPPSGGYTIYLNKESGGPSIFTPTNDSELILITNKIAGTNYTTVIQCLNYFVGQSDKMVLNRDYEGIVTDGLVLNLDAGFIPSYPTNGNTWYDIGLDGRNGTLTNGPTFNSSNGGSIVFDGVDDYGQLISKVFQGANNFSFSCFFKNTNTTYGFYGGPIYTEHTTGAGTNNTVGFWIGEPDVFSSNAPFRLAFWYQVSNVLQKTYSTSTIAVNRIVNATFVREGNQAKIYIDGVLDVSATRSTGALDTKTNNPLIASVGYGARFKGDIYTIQIYNRALSATEILQNYNATKGRYGL